MSRQRTARLKQEANLKYNLSSLQSLYLTSGKPQKAMEHEFIVLAQQRCGGVDAARSAAEQPGHSVNPLGANMWMLDLGK